MLRFFEKLGTLEDISYQAASWLVQYLKLPQPTS